MTDWSPLVQVASLGLTSIVIPWGIVAYQKRTGIVLTDQQRAQMLGAVQTAAGVLETKLDQGTLTTAHVTQANDAVRAEAQAAIAAVPNAAAALGMTEAGVARMIVGKVDTGAHGPPQALQAPSLALYKAP